MRLNKLFIILFPFYFPGFSQQQMTVHTRNTDERIIAVKTVRNIQFTEDETGVGVNQFHGHNRIEIPDIDSITFQNEELNLPRYTNAFGLVPDVADPYVLSHGRRYYLYGTGGHGIKVYESAKLVKWTTANGATNGYALYPGHVWGNGGFWAPEVYYLEGKFYMFYTADTKLSVATSDSPLGPFKQEPHEQFPMHSDIGFEIDSHLFIDDDGKKYLYFCRTDEQGIHINVAELEDDMRRMKENTIRFCIRPTQSWERSVNEGPFVLKHGNFYYLTFSGNGFEDKNYAVGYAVATSPLGPWSKAPENPILRQDGKTVFGPGHHSFTYSPSGQLYIVYHTHLDEKNVHPRKLAIDKAEFIESSSEFTAAKLRILGPTSTPQDME